MRLRDYYMPLFPLECLGQVYRHFKPKTPNFNDSNVLSYLPSIGESEEMYQIYSVVPKTIQISRNSISRFAQPPNPFSYDDELLYRHCWRWTRQEFKFYQNSVVYNYDEALSYIDMSKAAGYPQSLYYGDKLSYIHSPDNFWFEYWEALGTDDPHLTFSSVFVKEELRLHEKILQHNARTIIAMDTNHLISHTMLFQDQQTRLIKNCLKCSSALGLSLLEGGSQKLYEFLHPWGVSSPTIVSSDGKKFDSCYNVIAFDECYKMKYDFIAERYKSSYNELRAKNLSKQIYETVLVDMDGVLYFKDTGNDSGQKDTTVNNIEKNYTDHVFLWHKIMPVEYHDFKIFKKLVRMALVGDDIIMAVHPSIQHLWNPINIKKFSVVMNMTYEFEFDDFKYFNDVSFLGHRFVFTLVPKLSIYMWLPTIECNKMRTTMVRYNVKANTKDQLIQSLAMCAGLRIETFACVSCRKWFAGLWDYLFAKLNKHSFDYSQAQSMFLSDNQLWDLYTGFESFDIKQVKGFIDAVLTAPDAVDPHQ